MLTSWLRFAWDLESLPDTPILPPDSYVLRCAEKADAAKIQSVTASAFTMESSPGEKPSQVLERITAAVDTALESKSDSHIVVLQHGSRIIGASALQTVEEAENHLLTGPCIQHEYRSRKFGTLLLQASLAALRKAGLQKAYGIVREKTTSARFIYPKFNGRSEPWTPHGSEAPSLAA